MPARSPASRVLRASVALLLAGTAWPSLVHAQPQPTVRLDADVAHVPFRLIDNRVVFSAGVNGSEELVFVLDTGARASAVFGPIGDSLGLTFVGQARVGNGGEGVLAPVAIGESIQISPDLEIGNETIVAMLDQELGPRVGFEANGITGAALFTTRSSGWTSTPE